ncbi:NADPH-dependent FMN reductase [Lihuaxuella thermophila]|uniref:Chromate reductase n=1 Tax=Lihuaxuella thermophila TaxID=1173111 RepID=A0A1H8H3B9_9BACL|nr:NAD(P)H-dependent oxidoreductase [Lihuaxuella thermophila]SEN50474.1 chromate reductase [Lihuaxuella thermophila]
MSKRQVHIVGICGSLRKDSWNRKLLFNASQLLPNDYRFTLADISSIPPFNEDLESQLPQPVTDLARLAESADAFLISTPEYNYSVPGVLKNVLDWLSRPSAGAPLALKPVAIMGATPGLFGTARAQTHLRDILFGVNMVPVNRPEVLVPQVHTKFDEHGMLTDATTRNFLQQLMDALVASIR